METIIDICGWLAAGIAALSIAIFAAAFLWGCGWLGFRLATRTMRERRWWKRAVERGNIKVTYQAASTLCHRCGYGTDATLGDIMRDTYRKLNGRTS